MKSSSVYRVCPITTCQNEMYKEVFTYLTNYGEKILAPILAFLIQGGEEPILVDTGLSYEAFSKITIFASGGVEGAPIEDSLRNFGVSPSDIRTIILTHLHRDHFLQARKFPNAKLIIQEEELNFAWNPHPFYKRFYYRNEFDGLNFETVRGDAEIMPGLEVIFTPGHTPGGQSVVVNTEKGKVVIAGLCTIDDNFTKNGVIIPGVHVNTIQAYDSMLKITKLADKIIALHSQSAVNINHIP